MQTAIHRGACLCGKVRFEVHGDFEQLVLCYCSRCRRGTGSLHAANLFSSRATLRWLQGESEVRRYRLPETRHERAFCAHCGAVLPYEAGGVLLVPAGALDEEPKPVKTLLLHDDRRPSWAPKPGQDG